jgi:hypothetical protein
MFPDFTGVTWRESCFSSLHAAPRPDGAQEPKLLKFSAIGLALTAIYSDYPVFLKNAGVIEAYTDRGPIVELIVRCPSGTGIMSFSKIERLYCSSKFKCTAKLQTAVADTCR